MNKDKKFNPFKIIIVIFLLSLGVILYSRYIGPKWLIINETNVINSNIPNSFYGYKIVQISDIHYNNTIFKKDIKEIVDKMNKINPNIIVITGDLLDNNITYESSDKNEVINFLNDLKAEYKYIITGDHDQNDIFEEIINATDFKLLDNTYDVIYNGDYDPIIISGLSTKKDKTSITDKLDNTIKAIDNYKSTYNILLVHEPSIIDSIDSSKFNLVLAGHTHNGQFNIPYLKNLFVDKSDIKYNKKYVKLNESDIYISSGLGTTNIKGRLFNHPSIEVYRLLDK